MVQTQQFGLLPWWDPALTWLTPQDRQAVYKAKHGVGDTHCIVELPNGKPLYDEPDQAYSPDKFGPLDMTHGETRVDQAYIDLVAEVIVAGFIPIIEMDEVYENSIKCVELVTHALKQSNYGDLTKYCLILPGYDGVFYGWEPSNTLIPGWAILARSIAPDAYLGIEFNTGHIPLGNGPTDYLPNGLMTGFDVIFGEFDTGRFDDTVWQVLARMLPPGQYIRPPEQPAGDDPNPPHYLTVDNPRGPFYFIPFEYATYDFVRGMPTAEVEILRNKFISMGATNIC